MSNVQRDAAVTADLVAKVLEAERITGRKATGLCSAHRYSTDPACHICYPLELPTSKEWLDQEGLRLFSEWLGMNYGEKVFGHHLEHHAQRIFSHAATVIAARRAAHETPELHYHISPEGWMVCDQCAEEVVEARKCTGCGATTIPQPIEDVPFAKPEQPPLPVAIHQGNELIVNVEDLNRWAMALCGENARLQVKATEILPPITDEVIEQTDEALREANEHDGPPWSSEKTNEHLANCQCNECYAKTFLCPHRADARSVKAGGTQWCADCGYEFPTNEPQCEAGDADSTQITRCTLPSGHEGKHYMRSFPRSPALKCKHCGAELAPYAGCPNCDRPAMSEEAKL